MLNTTIRNIVGILAVAAIAFMLGFYTGEQVEEVPGNPLYPEIASIEMLKDLPVGGSIEIELEEGTTPATEFYQGETVVIEEDKDFGTLISLFGGISATEAASKDQGIDISKGGLTAQSGQAKGYGILEQLWTRIKAIFWFGSFTILILFILTFIPATAPIAGAILRALASVIPVLGSIVERLFAGLKWKKPLRQTVSGGQEFKRKIGNHPTLDVVEKDDVINIFRESMMMKQDEDSKREIKNIKRENGF